MNEDGINDEKRKHCLTGKTRSTARDDEGLSEGERPPDGPIEGGPWACFG